MFGISFFRMYILNCNFLILFCPVRFWLSGMDLVSYCLLKNKLFRFGPDDWETNTSNQHSIIDSFNVENYIVYIQTF